MNYRLSLVIPVYNTVKYLERCLDSIINQTCFEQIEVIVVNDGSTDDSQLIIDAYISRFGNIRSFVKTNGGLSDARNFGLQHVNGKYLAFLDSDDWVDPQLYLDCVDYMERNINCEFVSFNYVEEWVSNCKFIDCQTKITRSKYFMGSVAWNKVFRTDFWQQHQFKFRVGIKHEDTELLPKIIYYAHNYGFLENVNNVLHYDKTNQSSITKSCRDTRSWIVVFKSLVEFSENKNDIDLIKFIATTIFYQLILFGGSPSISYQIYCESRKIFDANNIVSRVHNLLKIIQMLRCDFLLKPVIYLLNKFSIDPNGFSA